MEAHTVGDAVAEPVINDDAVAVEGATPKPGPHGKVVDAPPPDEQAKTKPGRTEWQQYKRLKAEVERTKSEVESRSRELAEKSQVAEKWSKLEAKRAEDPLAVLEELGLDLDDLVRRKVGMNEGEDYANKLTKAMEAKMAEQQAAIEKRWQEHEAKLQAREQEIQQRQIEHNFVAKFTSESADKYIHMDAAGKDEYMPLAWEADAKIREYYEKQGTPKAPTYDEICEVVEAHLERQAAKWDKAYQRKYGASSSAAPTAKKPSSVSDMRSTSDGSEDDDRARAIAVLAQLRRQAKSA